MDEDGTEYEVIGSDRIYTWFTRGKSDEREMVGITSILGRIYFPVADIPKWIEVLEAIRDEDRRG